MSDRYTLNERLKGSRRQDSWTFSGVTGSQPYHVTLRFPYLV